MSARNFSTWVVGSTSEGVGIYGVEATGLTPCSRVPESSQDRVCQFRMTGPLGWLLLSGPRFVHVRQHGSDLSAVPPDPSHGDPDYSAKIHAGDRLTVVRGTRLFIFEWETGWRDRPLPSGVKINNVSFSPDGALWVAGAVPVMPREPGAPTSRLVLFCARRWDAPLERHPLGFWPGAWGYADALGGTDELQTVDAEATPIVATTQCAWFVDDPSSFVFVKGWLGKWRVHRLNRRWATTVLRLPGEATLVVCDEGEIFRLHSSGRIAKLAGKGPLAQALFGRQLRRDDELDLEVWRASAAGGTISVIAQVVERAHPKEIQRTAVCLTHDWGRKWAVLASTSPRTGEPMLHDVAQIPTSQLGV